MGRIIPRRWRRRAGEAAGRLLDLPATRRLKHEIAVAIPAGSTHSAQPYPVSLSAAVAGTHRAAPLAEVLRMLRATAPGEPVGRDDPAPLVSVVMPVRNRAGIVAEAVHSVLAQSHRRLELLVCDDASTDDTPATLDGISDPRLVRFRFPRQKGAAAARNHCLAVASGSVIAYLDSDNVWHPRFLELAIGAMGDEAAAHASFLDVALSRDGTASILQARIEPFDRERQIAQPYVDINSFVHRRELTARLGGFDERLVRRQDHDLILRYCWNEAPRHVPLALNIYRRADFLDQITRMRGTDETARAIIDAKIRTYRETGGPEP